MWILFAHQPAVTSPVDGRKDIDKAIGSDKERGSKEGHSGRPDWIGLGSLSRYIYIYIIIIYKLYLYFSSSIITDHTKRDSQFNGGQHTNIMLLCRN